MVDFSHILSKPVDEAKRPPLLPAGTYHGMLGQYQLGETKSDKKTPFVRYNVQLTGPGDDIDPSDLADIDLSKRTLYHDFYLTEDSQFRLREFMESCGLSVSGRSFGETIPELTGAQVLVKIVHRPSRDGSEIYANIESLVADK